MMKEYLGMMTAFAAMMGESMPGMRVPEKIRMVNGASYDDLANEYRLIQQKKSNLSRAQRDAVVNRVEYLVKKGSIILPK